VQSKLSVSGANASRLTAAEYRTLQDAYDFFNEELFDGSLPQVLITLQRHRRALGYFSAEKFRRRGAADDHIHEVALNPDGFSGSSDEEILSTLVHEMVHVWQQEHGRPGRGRYHNREWAKKMHSIGLMPSSTGKPGGAVTGDRVSHHILPNGAFAATCQRFLGRYRLLWETAPAGERQGEGDSSGVTGAGIQTRTKFSCPNCGLNVWAKPGALIDCHSCSEESQEAILMRASGSG
jgi:predicted RNA-binding Zn-ribbon protein involved in translation (DUF1610 family)